MDTNTDQHGNISTGININTRPGVANPVSDAPTVADEYPGVGPTDALRFSSTQSVFVARPGDRITITLGIGGNHLYDVADSDGHPLGHGVLFRLDFDIVTALRGARDELLPLCAEPEPEPEPVPLGQSVSFRHAKDGTLLDTTYTVSHSHPHDHNRIPGGPFSHAHPHTHDGRDSFRSTIYGHPLDPHAHDH